MDTSHHYIYYQLNSHGPCHVLEIWELYPGVSTDFSSRYLYHLKFQVTSPHMAWHLLNEHLQLMAIPPLAYENFRPQGDRVSLQTQAVPSPIEAQSRHSRVA